MLETVADAAGDTQVVLRPAAGAAAFGKLRQEIVHWTETQRQMTAERNVYAAANSHGKGVVRCPKDVGMRHAEQILDERREAAVMMEVHLRTKHVGEQI